MLTLFVMLVRANRRKMSAGVTKKGANTRKRIESFRF